MSEVVVVAEVELAPGEEEAGMAAVRELCEQTHANDEGCLLYAMHRVSGDQSRLVVIERWASMEALQTHGDADHIKAFAAAQVTAAPAKVTVLESLGFGDPDKGVL